MLFPLHDEHDKLLGFTKILRDYTHKKEKEDLLKSNLTYAESIINTLREPVLVLDAKLTVRKANRAFYNTFEVSREETLDRYIYELGNRQWDIPALRQLLETIIPENTHFEDFEIEHQFEKIGKKSMLLNARKLYRTESDTQMLLMAFEDITKEKELETLKDHFISVASHELKTPITAASGYIQLLERQVEHLGLAPAAATSMEKTKQQLLKLNDMVHQLLDLSKVTSGTRSLDFTEFSMDALVQEVIENHLLVNPDAEIRVHGSVGRNITADRLRIEQVLNNLIGNAIKYCFGSARVHIELSVTDNSSAVQVCISDNGIGIPVGEKERLFGLFSRASNAIRRKIPGIGLGLNISSEIIKKHGGKIWVESDGINGSTFCFTIPIEASMG